MDPSDSSALSPRAFVDTTFAYSGLTTNTTGGPIHHCAAVGVTVAVKNTGTVDSDEVVQMYATTPAATVPAPRIRLVDFARVHIKAGATLKVSQLAAPLRALRETGAPGAGGRALADSSLPPPPSPQVELVAPAPAHSVVMENVAGWEAKFWDPTLQVQAGSFTLHVGGGQPGVTDGVLEAAVVVGEGGSLGDCNGL